MNTAFIAVLLLTLIGDISSLKIPKFEKEVKEVKKAALASVENGTTIKTETSTVAANKEKEKEETLSTKKLKNKGGKTQKKNSNDHKVSGKSLAHDKTESKTATTEMPLIKQKAKDTKSDAKEKNVQEKSEIKSERVESKNDEIQSEEEIYDLLKEMVEDDLGAEAVKENTPNLIEDLEEDLYLPISGRLNSILHSDRVMDEPLLQSERVMDEPPLQSERVMDEPLLQSERVTDETDFLPRADAVMEEPSYNSEPETSNSKLSAERVMEQPVGNQPGGDGKMKMNLNLKALDGDPSDLTVGAAAVGIMEQAVRSKGPENSQVNAIAGFGHQIMGLVDELEKDSQ